MDQAAIDPDASLSFAYFFVDSTAFSIDGQATTADVTANDFIMFSEQFPGSFDLMGAFISVEFNGFADNLSPEARMSTYAFALSGRSATPPVLGIVPTTRPSGGMVSNSLYALTTSPGVVVTSELVPEPSSLLLLATGLAALAIRRSTRG